MRLPSHRFDFGSLVTRSTCGARGDELLEEQRVAASRAAIASASSSATSRAGRTNERLGCRRARGAEPHGQCGHGRRHRRRRRNPPATGRRVAQTSHGRSDRCPPRWRRSSDEASSIQWASSKRIRSPAAGARGASSTAPWSRARRNAGWSRPPHGVDETLTSSGDRGAGGATARARARRRRGDGGARGPRRARAVADTDDLAQGARGTRSTAFHSVHCMHRLRVDRHALRVRRAPRAAATSRSPRRPRARRASRTRGGPARARPQQWRARASARRAAHAGPGRPASPPSSPTANGATSSDLPFGTNAGSSPHGERRAGARGRPRSPGSRRRAPRHQARRERRRFAEDGVCPPERCRPRRRTRARGSRPRGAAAGDSSKTARSVRSIRSSSFSDVPPARRRRGRSCRRRHRCPSRGSTPGSGRRVLDGR